jgi:uncharacterized DUF497 family protein
MHFEWDPKKREANLEKHGIDFLRAVRIFDGFVLERPDTRQEYGELRVIGIGRVEGLIVTVVFTVREGAIRIISARRANRGEASKYREVRPEEA